MASSAAGRINEPVVFSEVLSEENCCKSRANLMENNCTKKKTDMTEVNLHTSPKRILYFSDGTLEECSSSEEDEPDGMSVPVCQEVNPKMLTWGPWTWYYVSTAGWKTLQVCDYLGESLANFFGITSPKYQYEIEEYYRAKAEEEEYRKKQDLEMSGWVEKKPAGDALVLEVVESQSTKTTGVVDKQIHSSSQRY